VSPAADLLARLARAGARLRVVDGNHIEYLGPRRVLTDEIRAEVRRLKVELVAWLRSPASRLPVADLEALDFGPLVGWNGGGGGGSKSGRGSSGRGGGALDGSWWQPPPDWNGRAS